MNSALEMNLDRIARLERITAREGTLIYLSGIRVQMQIVDVFGAFVEHAAASGVDVGQARLLIADLRAEGDAALTDLEVRACHELPMASAISQ